MPLEQINSTTGVVLDLWRDGMGSIRTTSYGAGTSDSSVLGNVYERAYYDAFGNIATVGPNGFGSLYSWQGQQQDSDSNMFYLHAREYDPRTGQFLTPDPLVSMTGEPYSYAGDNPINESDPSGLDCAAFWGVIGLGKTGAGNCAAQLGGWIGSTIGGVGRRSPSRPLVRGPVPWPGPTPCVN
jgi:RHS repeat-associated protein